MRVFFGNISFLCTFWPPHIQNFLSEWTFQKYLHVKQRFCLGRCVMCFYKNRFLNNKQNTCVHQNIAQNRKCAVPNKCWCCFMCALLGLRYTFNYRFDQFVDLDLSLLSSQNRLIWAVFKTAHLHSCKRVKGTTFKILLQVRHFNPHININNRGF